MNIKTKYDIGDSVCFFYKETLWKPEVFFGEVCRVAVSKESDESVSVVYSVHCKMGQKILPADALPTEHDVILSVTEAELYRRLVETNLCLDNVRDTVKAFYETQLRAAERNREDLVKAKEDTEKNLKTAEDNISVLKSKIDMLSGYSGETK